MKIHTIFYDLDDRRSLKVFVKADTVREAIEKFEAETPNAFVRSVSQEDTPIL